MKAHMKMMENQISQLAQSNPSPSSSSLPSQGVNPKSMCAITTRSGKVLEGPNVEKKVQEEEVQESEVERLSEEEPPREVEESERHQEKNENVETSKAKQSSPIPLNKREGDERLPYP